MTYKTFEATIPEQPEDLEFVLDTFGNVWTNTDKGPKWQFVVGVDREYLSWRELVFKYGPVTQLVRAE
ncbi:MAG: hypothetical protein PHQ41_03170 [Candidatus Cloacimonetes bacterium]|nr:hypothetical protein [Candidatus Cloacimonadota bacterium]